MPWLGTSAAVLTCSWTIFQRKSKGEVGGWKQAGWGGSWKATDVEEVALYIPFLA